MKNPVTHLFLAIFVAIGLLLSPLPVSAARDMQGSGQVMAMADEMPGCPGPMTPDECQKCPLMVVCLVKSLASLPAHGFGTAIAFGNPLAMRPRSDRLIAGLGQSPPARPPRTPGIPA